MKSLSVRFEFVVIEQFTTKTKRNQFLISDLLDDVLFILKTRPQKLEACVCSSGINDYLHLLHILTSS